MNSIKSELQILAARVERLEIRNRWWKRASAIFALSGVSLVLMGAKPADRIDSPVIRAGSVEAQEFILKDENGHVYARLSLRPSVLGMKQSNGRMYIVPGQGIPGQAALQFYGDKGEVVWTAPASPSFVPVK